MCLIIFNPATTVLAVDDDPAFSNPTQAQRAINVAEEYALEKTRQIESAQKEADQIQGEINAIPEGEEIPQSLLDELAAAERRVSDLISQEGVEPEDINDMRQEGMGWGEIMHELGLHPGLLGVGHKKGLEKNADVPDSEILSATKKNYKSGGSFKGHGNASEKSGKEKAADKADKDNGGGKANKGGNGKGNGKDK